MVLSEDLYSLSSGAVEGMGLGKPLILSKQPALIEYFYKGALFVDNSIKGIVNGIITFRDQEKRLKQEIDELAFEKQKRWEMRQVGQQLNFSSLTLQLLTGFMR